MNWRRVPKLTWGPDAVSVPETFPVCCAELEVVFVSGGTTCEFKGWTVVSKLKSPLVGLDWGALALVPVVPGGVCPNKFEPMPVLNKLLDDSELFFEKKGSDSSLAIALMKRRVRASLISRKNCSSPATTCRPVCSFRMRWWQNSLNFFIRLLSASKTNSFRGIRTVLLWQACDRQYPTAVMNISFTPSTKTSVVGPHLAVCSSKSLSTRGYGTRPGIAQDFVLWYRSLIHV